MTMTEAVRNLEGVHKRDHSRVDRVQRGRSLVNIRKTRARERLVLEAVEREACRLYLPLAAVPSK